MPTCRRSKSPSSTSRVGVFTLCCLAISSPAAAQQCRPTMGQRVVELLNQIRVEHKLPPFGVDTRLAQAARQHSMDMAKGRFLEHDGSNGSTPMTRIDAAGYAWTSVSENIAAGQPEPDSVVVAWMRSAPHRANILDGTAQHIGIGYALATDQYKHYWTANFGSTKGQVQQLVGGCHP